MNNNEPPRAARQDRGPARADSFGWLKRGDLSFEDIDYWEAPDGTIHAVMAGCVPYIAREPTVSPLDLYDEITFRDE